MARQPLLLLAAAVTATAAAGANARALPTDAAGRPLVGTLRVPLARDGGGGAAARRAQALAPPPAEYEHVRDAFAFRGFIPGVGLVDHAHDVVVLNTTAFLDDWAAFTTAASCAPRKSPARPTVDWPTLPPERAALRLHQPFTLTLAVDPAALPALVHRLTHAAHLVVGAAAEAGPLAGAPSCARFMQASSSFFVDGVRVMDSGGTATTPAAASGEDTAPAAPLIAVQLAPAPVLAGFASAKWRHVVKRTGLTAEDTNDGGDAQEEVEEVVGSPTRRLFAGTVDIERGVNYADGAVTQARLPVWSYTNATPTFTAALGVDCEGCYAFLSSDVTFELEFCAWARLRFSTWTPWGDKVWYVGVGPMGEGGCAAGNEDAAGVGYRLRVRAEHAGSVGFGFGLRATAALSFALALPADGYPLPLAQATLYDGPFVVLGIPVPIRVQAQLAVSFSANGLITGELFTGGVSRRGRFRHGFTCTGGTEGGGSGWVPVKEFTWDDPVTTPPSLSVAVGPSSLRLEPALGFNFTFFRVLHVTAELPVRFQADLNFTAPDAVGCDLPECALPAYGRPYDPARALSVYATWQPRVRVRVDELRLSHVVDALAPPWLRGPVSSVINGGFVLVPRTILLDGPLRGRMRLLSTCGRQVFSWTGGSAGGGGIGARVLVTTEADAAVATARVLRALPAPPVTPVAAATETLPRSLLRHALPANASADDDGPRSRLLTSSTCGSYRSGAPNAAGGSWSGPSSPCTPSGNGLFLCVGTCDNTCASTYWLYCVEGGTSSTGGYSSTCVGSQGRDWCGCRDVWYSFDDTPYCCKCGDGKWCPSGSGAANAERDCPAGSYCVAGVARQCPCGSSCSRTGMVAPGVCPEGHYCPTGATAAIPCTGYCPAGSCTQLSWTPSLSPSRSASPTASISMGATPSATGSVTRSPTATRSNTATPSGTPSISATASVSGSGTPTALASARPSCNYAVTARDYALSAINFGALTYENLVSNATRAGVSEAARNFALVRGVVANVSAAIRLAGMQLPPGGGGGSSGAPSPASTAALLASVRSVLCSVVGCNATTAVASGLSVSLASLVPSAGASGGARRLDGGGAAANGTVDVELRVAWSVAGAVSSSPLETPSVASLLSFVDFDDGLFFAHQHAQGAAALVTALVTGAPAAADDAGSMQLSVDCASVANASDAAVLGCVAGNRTAPFSLLPALAVTAAALGALAPGPGTIASLPSQPVVTAEMSTVLTFVSLNQTGTAAAGGGSGGANGTGLGGSGGWPSSASSNSNNAVIFGAVVGGVGALLLAVLVLLLYRRHARNDAARRHGAVASNKSVPATAAAGAGSSSKSANNYDDTDAAAAGGFGGHNPLFRQQQMGGGDDDEPRQPAAGGARSSPPHGLVRGAQPSLRQLDARFGRQQARAHGPVKAHG